MCGIAGIAEKEEVVDPATILSMTQEIRHRGPDDEGYLALNLRSRQVVPLTGQDSQVPGTQARQFRDPANLYLGHRRLSILDTSSDGHQPMASEDKKIWLVFNGEIYNYIEIRDELISYGHAFKTKTDTEVLLKAYQHWGADCVTHFNGMWAFVILDLQKNNLFGSRDRFGVKPLYYHYKEGAQFLFASEIKALHASGKIPVSFNDSAIFDYLSFGWQETESEGFFKDILELQPSHSFTFSLQSYQLKVWSYYSLPMNQTWEDFNPKKEQHHIDKIKSLLQDSIQKRLRSDVLVGSCLSGGLDSSSIVCYINILLKKNTSLSTGASQNVYTACFDDPRIDESHYAKLVVDQTQTTWHQSTPKSDELLADLGDLIRTQEIPFSSTSIYSQYRIMKLAKETGVKVLMDGVFGGYKAFYRGFFSEMLHKGDWGRLMSEWSHLDNAPISHRDLIKSQFLKKLNFNVIELENRKPYELDEGHTVTCGQMRGIDSWLLHEINGKKVLNINDCVIDSVEKANSILKTTGKVDILLTQFSYANWVGNPEDRQLRKNAASEKLECIRVQCEVFKPKHLIPFASFVYFSHEENKYHNDFINKIDIVEDYLKRNCKTSPVILYPGDTWDLQANVDNKSALVRYEKDYDLSSKVFHHSEAPVDISSLISMSREYVKNIKEKNNGLFLLMLLPKKYGMKELRMFICDIDEYCIFTLKNGLKVVGKRDGVDITIWSSSLAYIFQHEWGIGSVLVNGRFRASKFGRLALDRIFMASIFNSVDTYISFGFLINRVLIKLFRIKNLATEEEFSYHKAWRRLGQRNIHSLHKKI